MTEINDSELLEIEKIQNWAAEMQGKTLSVDQFAKDLTEKFAEIGFAVDVKVYDTNQTDAYAFEVEITGRTGGSAFDPDRQVHEVVNNLLELPGQDKGFIPSKEYLDKLVSGENLKQGKHKH